MSITLPLLDERLDAPSRELFALSQQWPMNGLSVLDLASGSGRNSIWLASQGADVYAVDSSLKELALLKLVAAELGLGVAVTNGRVQDLNWDGLYDVVLFHGILHFLPHDVVSMVVERAMARTKASGLHLISLASPLLAAQCSPSKEPAMGADESFVRAQYNHWIDIGSEAAERDCKHVDGRIHTLDVTRLAFANGPEKAKQLASLTTSRGLGGGSVERRILLSDGRIVAEELVRRSSGIFRLPPTV